MSLPAAWFPYCGAAATPADFAWRWNLDPVVMLALGAAGAWTLWRGRDWRIGAALLMLAVIFVSPLCALSSALFSARTIHHLLLIAVAAPLLAWGLPTVRAKGLALATAVSAGIFWAWHAPAAYGWALSNDGAYWLMQATLGSSALWFWTQVRAARPLAAVGALLAATIQMGLLGALLTFATRPFYAPHFDAALAWGLTPIQDQQAAGLIMWAPASAVYLAAAVTVLGRSLAGREAVPAA